MNIQLTLSNLEGLRPLYITDPVTFNLDGMFIGNHLECDTLKLFVRPGTTEAKVINIAHKMKLILDGTERNIIQFYNHGFMFDLEKETK